METLKLIVVLLILLYYAAGCGNFKGPAGPEGARGETGTSGISGVSGATGVPGPAGPQGPQGQQGPAGSQGPAGQQGPVGSQGSPGTTISVVELCLDYGSTQYPTSFPEQALCIDNTLYGVYWTGSEAFLAELPPGVYASTSPDGCTLTVSANCQVSEND